MSVPLYVVCIVCIWCMPPGCGIACVCANIHKSCRGHQESCSVTLYLFPGYRQGLSVTLRLGWPPASLRDPPASAAVTVGLQTLAWLCPPSFLDPPPISGECMHLCGFVFLCPCRWGCGSQGTAQNVIPQVPPTWFFFLAVSLIGLKFTDKAWSTWLYLSNAGLPSTGHHIWYLLGFWGSIPVLLTKQVLYWLSHKGIPLCNKATPDP